MQQFQRALWERGGYYDAQAAACRRASDLLDGVVAYIKRLSGGNAEMITEECIQIARQRGDTEFEKFLEEYKKAGRRVAGVRGDAIAIPTDIECPEGGR